VFEQSQGFPRATHTSTYAVLEDSPASFRDIKNRLIETGALNDYFDQRKNLLVLGTIALREQREDDSSIHVVTRRAAR
jgi:hypothetical protein